MTGATWWFPSPLTCMSAGRIAIQILSMIDRSVVTIGRRRDVEGSQYEFIGRSIGMLSDQRKFSVWKLFPDFEILGSNGEVPKPEHVVAGHGYKSDLFPGDFVHVQIALSRR
jgi:hypothetical protein